MFVLLLTVELCLSEQTCHATQEPAPSRRPGPWTPLTHTDRLVSTYGCTCITLTCMAAWDLPALFFHLQSQLPNHSSSPTLPEEG